jgi:hypothetical protein
MSGHKDRAQALATTTLDLGHKLDGVIGTQAQHSEALASLRSDVAVIANNQLDTHREVKANSAALAAIMAHLGIGKS